MTIVNELGGGEDVHTVFFGNADSYLGFHVEVVLAPGSEFAFYGFRYVFEGCGGGRFDYFKDEVVFCAKFRGEGDAFFKLDYGLLNIVVGDGYLFSSIQSGFTVVGED